MQSGNTPLEVIWTNKALDSYERIIEYILDKFTVKEAEALQIKINTFIDNISNFRHICPLSKKKNIHKCVVHKNTSLIYAIRKNELRIIMVLDNRKKNSY